MMKTKLFTRNFTFLVLGQVSSLMGNGILKLALSLYVLDITGSAAIFAGLLSIATIPTILFSPLGGVLADRANRRNVMVGLDLISGITVFSTFLLFNENYGILLIGVLLMIQSVLGAFESPTVQASVPQMQTGENIIRGNAVINQAAAISGLIAPILGSILYTAFGLKKIMLVGAACFFLTALLECFIKLAYVKVETSGTIFSTIRSDFANSFRFISQEQPQILKILLLAAALNFLLVGVVVVGLPYLVRTVLGLSAKAYGGASSALGLSAILGGLTAGLLVTKLNIRKLHILLVAIGLSLVPIAAAFLAPNGVWVKYAVIVAALFICQFLIMIFSIFALSIIQQRTPDGLIGKVMSYATTVSLCAQPLGQILYGFVFDWFFHALFWVFLITGLATAAVGVLSKQTFSKMDPPLVEEEIASA